MILATAVPNKLDGDAAAVGKRREGHGVEHGPTPTDGRRMLTRGDSAPNDLKANNLAPGRVHGGVIATPQAGGRVGGAAKSTNPNACFSRCVHMPEQTKARMQPRWRTM